MTMLDIVEVTAGPRIRRLAWRTLVILFFSGKKKKSL